MHAFAWGGPPEQRQSRGTLWNHEELPACKVKGAEAPAIAVETKQDP
jgi:hypothetical protein